MRFLLLLLVLAAGGSSAAGAPEALPSAAMMAPVRQLVDFMSRLPAAEHAPAFAAQGVCILENFAPFIFCGRDAVGRWEAGFRAHASDLSELAATFGAAHDFSTAGDRVYFSLPTIWTGFESGKHFEEHGAWAFVLQRDRVAARAAVWHILGYGWAVTEFTESR